MTVDEPNEILRGNPSEEEFHNAMKEYLPSQAEQSPTKDLNHQTSWMKAIGVGVAIVGGALVVVVGSSPVSVAGCAVVVVGGVIGITGHVMGLAGREEIEDP